VNTPYDVFILPLQPSGLDGKGPRFVVHVPGPEARGGGKAAPPRAPVGATLSNPWTGKPRDYRDVDSDPEGVLCVEPGAPLKAAPSTPVRVSWADFWIAQGDWPTANDYAAFEKAEQWLLAQQPAAGSVGDTRRMDWLEQQVVEVRRPMRYGSIALFHAEQVSDDDEPYRTDLRAQIDSELATQQSEVDKEEEQRHRLRLVIAHLEAVLRGTAMDERVAIEYALENARAALAQQEKE
jgi:hypothetical protein